MQNFAFERELAALSGETPGTASEQTAQNRLITVLSALQIHTATVFEKYGLPDLQTPTAQEAVTFQTSVLELQTPERYVGTLQRLYAGSRQAMLLVDQRRNATNTLAEADEAQMYLAPFLENWAIIRSTLQDPSMELILEKLGQVAQAEANQPLPTRRNPNTTAALALFDLLADKVIGEVVLPPVFDSVKVAEAKLKLAKFMRRKRRDNDWTQTELASKLTYTLKDGTVNSFTFSAISSMENMAMPISLDTLEQLIEKYRISEKEADAWREVWKLAHEIE